MKIYSIEIFNLNNTGTFAGQPVPKGCLGVVVDKISFDLYQQLPGGVFFSECDGILSIYKHSPGAIEGLSGREVIIPVAEPSLISSKIMARRLRVFKGSLRSSAEARLVVAKHLCTGINRIAIRERNAKYDTYCAAVATDEFISRISGVVVIGDAESSPLL